MARSLARMVLVCVCVCAAPSKRIGWWWDAPASASDPTVDALLAFAREHTPIVSSVLMRCGPSTALGNISGDLSAACARAIPALGALGVDAELWLGNTGSRAAALALMADSGAAARALLAIVRATPLIKGFNFDLEITDSTAADAMLYARFLGDVRVALNAVGVRITADVSCHSNGLGWAPIIGNCSLLAGSVDAIMNMATYNAGSYGEWLQYLAPATAAEVPLAKVGMGLACYVTAKTNGTWSVTAKSAKERMCVIKHLGATEVDMFRLNPPLWPEAFWLPHLYDFMANTTCTPPPLPPSVCPTAAWLGPDEQQCCIIASAAVNVTGCASPTDKEACARAQCEASSHPIHVWKPVDYHHNPYTCCTHA